MTAPMEAKPCPVCHGDAKIRVAPFGDAEDVNCRRCGEFKISGIAIAMLATIEDRDRRIGYHVRALRWVEPGDKPFIRNI